MTIAVKVALNPSTTKQINSCDISLGGKKKVYP